MELTKNHLAVESACIPAPRSAAACTWTALLSGILRAPVLVDTADEVHDIADVVLRNPVIDPGRHGGSLHAVEDGIEQPPVGRFADEPGIAQIARPRQNIERVRSLAVGFTSMAPGATGEE